VTALLLQLVRDSVWWLLAFAIAAALIGAVAGAWWLVTVVYARVVAHGLRGLTGGLPGHRPGRIVTSRAARRRLIQDLALLLAVAVSADDDAR